MAMVWAVVSWSWGIRPAYSPVYGLPRGGAVPAGACWRDRNVLAGPVRGPASRFGGLCAGQFTAERVKTRMAAAVMSIAQPARTSRLRAASVVVLVIPQMLCRPAPVWSSTP
jgi:hypothetical protein